jgi:hypothetical protein
VDLPEIEKAMPECQNAIMHELKKKKVEIRPKKGASLLFILAANVPFTRIRMNKAPDFEASVFEYHHYSLKVCMEFFIHVRCIRNTWIVGK